MIKTTSFSHPRSAQSGPTPSSKVAARQHAIKAAKARAASQPTTGSLFASPAPLPEISAAQARDLIQSTTPQPTKRVSTPLIVTPQPVAPAPLPTSKNSTSAPVMTATSKPAKTTTKTPKTKVAVDSLSSVVALRVEVVAPAPTSVETGSVTASAAATKPVKAAAAPKKAKRARVPANLAEQYGQNISKRVESGIEVVPAEEETPKKRLSRTERQARRELMNPDEDLMARLHRAHNAIPTSKPEKRPRGWRFDCGRCGQTSYFQTTGALCGCGALAIKE